ncbi:MAG: arylesterase [Porticoccaceae bacterium]|nr:arylesterase [Porticoccaceae bacterium]
MIMIRGVSFSRYFTLCLAALLLALMLAGCGNSAKLSPLPEDATVLAFGDSLTVGVGVEPINSYPAVLAKHININVINAGVSGEVTADGKLRLKDLLTEFTPGLVIICHGGNDFLHRFSMAETETNLREMISHAQSLDVEVLLIGVPKPGIWGRAPDLYKRLAREFKVPLDDQTLGELETDQSMKSDPVHFNKQGYQKMAEAVVALLAEAGAVSASPVN